MFEGALIEVRKTDAPSLELSEFNYLMNKVVRQYVNKVYNRYDVNQQSADDLRVLKSTAILKPHLSEAYTPHTSVTSLGASVQSIARPNGAVYEIELPGDYLHLLNCICTYKVHKTVKCYDAGSYVSQAARRLTADSWSIILNDYYNRPSPERPYYYIHNVNTNTDQPTNLYDRESNKFGTDTITIPNDSNPSEVIDKDFPKTLTLEDIYNKDTSGKSSTYEVSLVEKPAKLRNSNASKVRCEIRYGKDNTVFELVEVMVDYLKSPQNIRLTQEQLDLTEDTSQIIEFPDYICQEIINELVHSLMELNRDQRLQSHAAISQSIAQPAQNQQTPQ